MNKVIIAGGRDFDDYIRLKSSVNNITSSLGKFMIVHGACPTGADFLADIYAWEMQVDAETYPAMWEDHGKKAGPIRNAQMAKVADYLIAFWDGKSKGTKSMINLAKSKGLGVRVVKYDPVENKF